MNNNEPHPFAKEINAYRNRAARTARQHNKTPRHPVVVVEPNQEQSTPRAEFLATEPIAAKSVILPTWLGFIQAWYGSPTDALPDNVLIQKFADVIIANSTERLVYRVFSYQELPKIAKADEKKFAEELKAVMEATALQLIKNFKLSQPGWPNYVDLSKIVKLANKVDVDKLIEAYHKAAGK